MTQADRSSLTALLDRAGQVQRSGCTEASLQRLDAAVEIATVVLAGSSTTQPDVDRATGVLRAALDALEVDHGPVSAVATVERTVRAGDASADLPATVAVTFQDGHVQQVGVGWDAYDLSSLRAGESVTVSGTLANGAALPAKAVITRAASVAELRALLDALAASGDLAGVAAHDLRAVHARAAAAETAGDGTRVESELQAFRTYVTGAHADRISVVSKTHSSLRSSAGCQPSPGSTCCATGSPSCRTAAASSAAPPATCMLASRRSRRPRPRTGHRS